MEIKIKDLITDKIPGEWGEEVIDGKSINVIRTANFTNFGHINFSNIVHRKIDERKIDQKQLKQGDVIIEKSGGSPTQPVGRVVYFDLVTDEIYLCNNFTAVLRPNKLKIYPKYFFYQLLIGYIRGKTLKYQNKTTGIINLKLDHYINEKIFVPSKQDQIRIAEVLTKVEILIQKRKESISLLDDFLRSTFLDMFGDPVKGEKFQRKSFKSISTVRQGLQIPISERKTDKGYNRYPYITNQFINGGKIAEFIENPKPTVICTKEDVLMTRTGNTGIVLTDVEGVFHNNFFLIDYDRKQINKKYLVAFLQLPQIKKVILKKASTSTIPDLNHGEFYKITLPIPPIKLQNKFALIVEKAEKVKEQCKESLKELENLFSSLSQKAFKGELDLSKLDVSAQIKEIEQKIEVESDLDISLETKLTKSMQQFIKQTTYIQKKLDFANNVIPKALLKQIESLNKSVEPFQNLNKIPEQLALAMKSFDGIKSITSQLNQEAKEKYTTKLTWEEVNFEMVANWIKEEFSEYHFNSEILLHFLENERVTFPNYYSSEELKTNPKLNEEDDIKSFVFSALKSKNQFIKLEQVFYDAVIQNIQLNLRSEDYEIIKDNQLRSGVYFKVVE